MPALFAVAPLTKSGERGPVYLVEDVDACIARHGARWLSEGYTRLSVEPHVPTVIVGDRRKVRR